MLTLVSGTDSLVLSREDARDLELKLNVSYYGHEWRAIGNALFDFHSTGAVAVAVAVAGAVTGAVAVAEPLDVGPEQFAFLKKLLEMRGWESCKNFGAPKK